MFTIDLKITKPAPVRKPRAETIPDTTNIIEFPKAAKLPKTAAKPRKARKPRPQRAAGVGLGKWAAVGKGRTIRVASPELTGEAGIAEVRKLIDDLVAAGCTVEGDEGLYVRVKPEPMTAVDLSKVAINAMWFESFLDGVSTKDRRLSYAADAKSNRAAFGGYGTTALNNAIGELSAAAATKDAAAVVEALQHGDEAFKVNLIPYLTTGQIEFRQHAGTFDAASIENWVRLIDAMMAKAKTSRPRSRGAEKAWTAAEEAKLFYQLFNVSAETRTFCNGRLIDRPAPAAAVITAAAA